VLDLIGQLPNPDRRALHALGEAIGGTEPQTLATFLDTINAWLAAQLSSGAQDAGRLARVATAWEKINAAASEVQEYNLERKPLVFAIFGWLAEAAR
jgi:DNA polymerase-3 subunit delta'